jgi:hypothetical protein
MYSMQSISWLLTQQACMRKMTPFNGIFIRRTFGYVFESFSLTKQEFTVYPRVIRVTSSQTGVVCNAEFAI